MKVTNETNYDIWYLRRLFLACEKHEGTNPKHRCIRVIYSRSNRAGGYAWYDSSNVVMKLPRKYRQGSIPHVPQWAKKRHSALIKGIDKLEQRYPIVPLPARRVAQIYIHEVGHNLGLHHKDMPLSVNIDISWLPDESVPLKAAKLQKPKPNVVEVRAIQAQKKLDKWQIKLKRAKTYVKKYRKKVQYYEKKRIAASNGL